MELAGIEAVSRGAKKAILCDNSKQAVNIINKNIEKTHMNDEIEVYRLDFRELLEKNIKGKIDIIFLDPPYKTDFAYEAVKLILENNLIEDNGLIIIETDQEGKLEEQLANLSVEITDKRKYGRIHLIFLSQKRKG